MYFWVPTCLFIFPDEKYVYVSYIVWSGWVGRSDTSVSWAKYKETICARRCADLWIETV